MTIIINGKEYKTKRGETVLEVCRREGIYIPTLCYQENLSPYGGCRLCIVEVEGNPRPMTACTLPVQDGMVINTDTPLLRALRKFTLELILSEHPYSCLICAKKTDCNNYMECIEKEPITFGCKYCAANGVCELQKLVEEFGIKEIPHRFQYRNLPVENYDPFFERDYNLCILCGRCVRACNELRNAAVIDFHHRGPKTLVGTAFALSHIEANCQFCGACVDACPTGAMRERYSKYLGRPDQVVKSYCMLCSIGCQINAEIKDGKIIRTTPNGEPLCVRGRFGIAPLINHPKRVITPLLRKDGHLVELNWDEALEIVEKIFRDHKERTGVLFAPDLPVEAINALSTFADISGIENFGAEMRSIENFATACLEKFDTKLAIIALNIDIINDFNVFLLKMRKIVKEKPVVILIDPIKTKSAEMVDLYLRPRLGEEWAVVDAILGKEKPREFAGIKKEELLEARKLIVHRDICVLYNPFNIKPENLSAKVKCFPLIGTLNFPILNSGKLFSADDIFDNEEIECLYLIGVNLPLGKRYKKVIVQDCFLPDFDFDLFLPAATFMEIEGSFIDFYGKEKKLKKVIEPPGNARADEWIIKNIIERLDFAITRKTNKPRTVQQKEMSVDATYPFSLVVRENVFRYRNKALSKILTGFRKFRQDHYLWINPADARQLKIESGRPVKVIAQDFTTEIEILVTEDVPPGILLAYYDREKGLVRNCSVRIERL